jgi:hypothetical protein
MHRPMEELAVFAWFEEVSDRVWEVVQGWRQLAQDTIGKQLIRSADSVGANLVEGDGGIARPMHSISLLSPVAQPAKPLCGLAARKSASCFLPTKQLHYSGW